MNILNRIIIYLFEHIAFDAWVAKQEEEAKRDFMRIHGIDTDEEYQEQMLDILATPSREAFYAGYDKAVRDISKGEIL